MNIEVRASLAGPHDHRIAQALSILCVAVALVMLPFAKLQFTPVDAVLGLASGAGFVSFAAAAYLLAIKTTTNRSPGIGALAASFAGAAVLVGAWGLSFPNAFSPMLSALHVRNESTPWLSIFWHGSVVAGIFAYRYRVRTPHVAVLGAVTLACIAIASYAPLPQLFAHHVMTPVYEFAIAPLQIVSIAAAGLVIGRDRGTSLDTWLRLVVIALACDLVLQWAGGMRFSLGWYASRTYSVLAPIVLLGVLMVHVARLYRDIALEAELHKEHAGTDPLTNMANRRRFDAEARLAVERANRYGRALSVAMIDVDRFKRFNDQYGHVAGDEALRAVGDVLKTQLTQPGDLVARYGGEEFVALFEDTTAQAAVTAIERVRASLLMMGIPHASAPAGVLSFSCGVATLAPGEGLLELLDRADIALYAAKRDGRDRIVCGETSLSVA